VGVEAAAASAEATLQPSAAARRVATQVQLSGTETGTMWTFENPPLQYWAKTYSFHPSPEWLQHVRLSSVRFGKICSASFVSGQGLVLTNHHCARQCVEAASKEGTDYLETGFYAAHREDERLCPGPFLDQLVRIGDVSERVRAAVPGGTTDLEASSARDSVRKAIENECEADEGDGFHCQVVSLYHGGQYMLYTYRRFSPVKLVFAPELQAGFFGGDPDNFTYPRYALDVAFVRAYAPDSVSPAATPEHFEWNAAGASEGDLVFITGNPGSTSRLSTVAQLGYERAFRHPFYVALFEGERDFFRGIARRGPAAERAVREQMFEIENSLKAFRGELKGLRDTLLMGRKIRWEREFQTRVAADPELATAYGDVWERLAALQADKLRTSPALNANNFSFIGSPHMRIAGDLVRYLHAAALPDSTRPDSLGGAPLDALAGRLRSPMRPNADIGAQLLGLRLSLAARWLPPDDPFMRAAVREGESPADAATRLVRETRVGDPDFRAALLDAGTAALDTTSDPLLRLAIQMDRTYGPLATHWKELTAAEKVQEERLAKAMFAVFGTRLPPDATFTLRISDGVVKRYPYNGTFAPARTTFYGLYARSAEFDDEMPWKLPARFADRQSEVDLATPLDFVSTLDITGGNSGSPILDREARVVGVAFDGNIEQLPNQFLFQANAGRTVGVHSAGISEALRAVYGADGLLKELTGSGRP